MDAMRFAKPTDDSIPLTPVYEDDLAQLRGGLSAFETSWYLRFMDDIYARFEL
mgnify:CR=1 FL=1